VRWLLRTRLVTASTAFVWVALAALPLAVPYPTVRAGIQWLDLGAVTVVLPLVVSIGHRWQMDVERMIGPARVLPALFDTALVAVMPLGAGTLGAFGNESAAHAVVPSLALGALALLAGCPGVPRALAAVPVAWLAVSMLLGDRAEGGREAWALPIATGADGVTILGLAIVFLIACVSAVVTDFGRGRFALRS